jgi:hypothetical protein
MPKGTKAVPCGCKLVWRGLYANEHPLTSRGGGGIIQGRSGRPAKTLPRASEGRALLMSVSAYEIAMLLVNVCILIVNIAMLDRNNKE